MIFAHQIHNCLSFILLLTKTSGDYFNLEAIHVRLDQIEVAGFEDEEIEKILEIYAAPSLLASSVFPRFCGFSPDATHLKVSTKNNGAIQLHLPNLIKCIMIE